MKREEIQKLLGGYATGTLTPSEREALFAAALEDQQLFEELLGEEPLREALEDPDTRAQLLAALDDAAEPPAESPAVHKATPQPWYYRDVHPGVIAGAAAVLVVLLAIRYWPVRTAPPLDVVAQTQLPQPTKSAVPTELPPSSFVQPAARKAVPQLPEAPVIPASLGAAGTPEMRRALDTLLAQSSPGPAPPGALSSPGLELARGALRAQAMLPRPSAPPAPLGLRYTILRKLPGGEFAPVDPRQELDAADQTIIRFEPGAAGFLYVLERTPDGWRRIAADEVQPSTAYTVPRGDVFRGEGGPVEFQVLFAREAQNVPERAPARIAGAGGQQVLPGPTTTVISTAVEQKERMSLFITLRYPSR
jgi:hypothetical protein